MTTATIGQRAEEQVRQTVRALRSAHAVSIRSMCERAGISRGTYFSRMNGSTSFTAGEVAELADLFGVAIEDLYSGRITLGPVPPADSEYGAVSQRYSACKPESANANVLVMPGVASPREIAKAAS